jgi:hypothetical protein
MLFLLLLLLLLLPAGTCSAMLKLCTLHVTRYVVYHTTQRPATSTMHFSRKAPDVGSLSWCWIAT